MKKWSMIAIGISVFFILSFVLGIYLYTINSKDNFEEQLLQLSEENNRTSNWK